MATIPNSDARTPPRRRLSLERRQNISGVLLALPAIIAFLVMVLYPFVNSFRLAFFEKTLLKPERFVGVDNIVAIFSNPITVQSLWVSVIYVVSATAATFILGLIWAVIINEQFRGRFVVRTLTLVPWILPGTVAAFLFAWIFNGRYGIINMVLLELGVLQAPVPWLASPQTAMLAVIIAKTWLSVPMFALFFLAGLQSLPRELVEATKIDGGGNIAVIRHVVMPHLRWTMVVVTVLAAKGNIQHFDTIYAMTGGGPVRATSTIAIEIYRQAFDNWNTGLAAALGVVMFTMIAIPSFLYLRRS